MRSKEKFQKVGKKKRQINKQTNWMTEANFKSGCLGNRPGAWRSRLNLQTSEKQPEAGDLSPEAALGKPCHFASRLVQKCKYALHFVFPPQPG